MAAGLGRWRRTLAWSPGGDGRARVSDTEDPYGDVASAVHRAEEEPAPQGIWSGKLGREIAVEQRHLDRVYDRLAELRRQAQEIGRAHV